MLLNIGCQSQNKSGEKSTDISGISTEPVTLKLMVAHGFFAQEDFEAYFVEQVKKKYPHITLEMVSGKLQDTITSGDVPDILIAGLPGIPALQDYKS